MAPAKPAPSSTRLAPLTDNASHLNAHNTLYIRDVQPPRDLIDSMAGQMKAERRACADPRSRRLASIGNLARRWRDAGRRARGRRPQGSRLPRCRARQRLAEAEARTMQMVSDAIANGSVQAINCFVARKYVEAFKALATAPNQKFVLMPMESSGIIGSIAGIAELAKQAAGKTNAPMRVPPMPPTEPCAGTWRSGAVLALLLIAAQTLVRVRSCCGWGSLPQRCAYWCRCCRTSRCCGRSWRLCCSASSWCRCIAPGFAARAPRAIARYSIGVPSS
ncbi:membrane protease [Xanthomonas campestris pv. leeana]|nr:membrane protease [Xanthomonas campestris pv. thespesiae]OOW80088.1 membrane protease [Xanthomonas campestris pv. leeana]